MESWNPSEGWNHAFHSMLGNNKRIWAFLAAVEKETGLVMLDVAAIRNHQDPPRLKKLYAKLVLKLQAIVLDYHGYDDVCHYLDICANTSAK